MRLGLRWQLLVSLVALMVATFVLVSLAILGTTQHNLQAQAVRSATRLAHLAAETAASSVDPALPLDAPYNVRSLTTLCELVARHYEGARVQVLTANGGRAALAAAYPPAAGGDALDVFAELALGTGEDHVEVRSTDDGVRQVEVITAIPTGPTASAVVRLAVPLADVQQAVSVSQQLMLSYLLLVVSLVLVFGLLVLTRVVVRPLHAISVATERVAQGDLLTRVDVDAPNEIGELARNFDAMVERLRAARAALEGRVAELAASNAALERAKQELVLSEKLATIGTLASGIAHEVGNPLAAVIGLVDVLRDREGLDDADVDDALARVDRELQRIHVIIRGLLDYSRVSAGEPSAVAVGVPLRAAVALCAHHPRARRMQLVLPPGDGPAVWVNENRLVQVFLNLLLNAADAADGAGRVQVSWRELDDGGRPGVRVDVADDGPGVPAAVRGRVFDPFFTTKEPGEGTGLGLAMSLRIAGQYGGRLWLDTPSEGAGATFALWLPSPAPDRTE